MWSALGRKKLSQSVLTEFMTLPLAPSEYEEKCQTCDTIAPLEAIHLDFDGQFRCRPCSLGGEFTSIAQANKLLAKYAGPSRLSPLRKTSVN